MRPIKRFAWGRSGSPGEVGMLFQRSGWGLDARKFGKGSEAFQKVWEGLGGPDEGLGGVEGPDKGLGGVEGPLDGPRGVGRHSRRSGKGREPFVGPRGVGRPS